MAKRRTTPRTRIRRQTKASANKGGIMRKSYKPVRRSAFRKWKRKTTTHKPLEISQHNDLSLKKLPALTLGKTKAKTIGTMTYINENQWIVEASQGEQGVGWPEANMTRQQIIGDTSPTIAERVRWFDDPFTLLLEPTIEPTLVYPAPFPLNGFDTDKLYLKTVDHTLEILSMTNLPQHVYIYWLMPKQDTNVAPDILWQNILTAKNFTQGAATIPNSVLSTTAIAGRADYQMHGQMPWEHKEFRKAWTAVRSEEIVLQPGDQRKYHLLMNYNKILNKLDFKTNRTMTYLRGLTVIPFLITKGGLVGMQRLEEENTIRVAHGFTKVGVLSTYKMHFGNLPSSRKSTTRIYQGTIAFGIDKSRIIDAEDEEIDAIFS